MACGPKRKHCLFMNSSQPSSLFPEWLPCAIMVAEWGAVTHPHLMGLTMKYWGQAQNE